MGLDMYLSAKKYIGYGDEELGQQVADLVKSPFGPVKEVEVEAMYWRKANAIHKWFVDNVQDGVDECQESYVTRDHLEALRDTCRQVLADHKQATTLLPTTSGFFFGQTDYDEFYYAGLESTADELDDILKADQTGWGFYYRASW